MKVLQNEILKRVSRHRRAGSKRKRKKMHKEFLNVYIKHQGDEVKKESFRI